MLFCDNPLVAKRKSITGILVVSFTVILLLAYPQAPSITRLIAGSVIASFLIAIPIRYVNFVIDTPVFLVINTLAINAFHLNTNNTERYLTIALFNGVWKALSK